MQAGRVESFDELERPGDYFPAEAGWNGFEDPRVFFILPNRDDLVPRPESRSVYSVASPPHTFRECDDGSVEVRASIVCA